MTHKNKNILKLIACSLVILFGFFIFSNLCNADQAAANGLLINEIVASDPNGGDDWIEFYVVGDDAVYLGDYSVVDDNVGRVPALLPDVTLSPGEFIVIKAVNEPPTDGSSYVPFRLGADDSVTLLFHFDVVDVLDWLAGDAPAGFSYGRFPDGTGMPQTLVPTPNGMNQMPQASDLVINEIVASDPNGGDDWIEFYVVGDDAVYLGDYSVVDDSVGRVPAPLPDVTLSPGEFIVIKAVNEPPTDGSSYVPFRLGADDSVTLLFHFDVVDVLDWIDGEAPAGFSYGLSPDGTGDAQPLTPTPGWANQLYEPFATDKVIEVRLELAEEDWQAIVANPMAEEYQPARIIYNGIRIDTVALRTKGQSSLMSVAMNPNSNRYSFKVDINYYVAQDLFGLQKINLNNGFADPTFMREYLSYQLMRQMGIPTPRNCFVNLYINDELFGLYLAVEQVDDEFVESRFEHGDGDLYKAEMGSDLLWKGESIVNYPGLELKTNEGTTDHSALLTMLDELNNGSDYESVIDVDGVLRYLAVSTVLTNLDSYQGSFAQNYYLYEENGVFTIIPWDFNISFGGFNMGCDRMSLIEFMIDEPTMGALSDRPLIDKLLQNPGYLTAYNGYIYELITGPFNPSTMDQVIDETADLIREYVYADPAKFYSAAAFEQALTDDLTTDPNTTIIQGFGMGFSLIVGLKTFVYERVASISDQLGGLAPASGYGSGNCQGGFGPGGGGFGPGGGFMDAIATVSPAFALQGDMNLVVTITLSEQMQMFPADANILSVKIGTLEGANISRSGLEIAAVFDIPVNEPVGMRDVSVEFEQPDFDPNGQPPPGGLFDPNRQPPPGGWFDPNGQPPLPPGGGFMDPNTFQGNIVLTKSDAFEIRAGGGQPPGPPPSAIDNVSPSSAAQGATDIAVTITLSQDMAMLPSFIIPVSVKIGQLEGSDIARNGLLITAVFDIPAAEVLGMKTVSVTLPPSPMDPNGQPMILTKTDGFEIVRGYIPFTIGSARTDEIVTDIPVFTPGGFYDESILRTIYLEFDQNDWWQQLEMNYNSETNILATLTMDGVTYPDVGIRFKGMTSYMMAGNSRKKSFNIEIDDTHPDQRLMGYKTLNLHNSSMDPTFIREVLYFNIFRKYSPCPQANFVKLFINGENWGIYVNVQQQNAELIEEWFKSSDGDRWKVGMGNFRGGFFDPNMQRFSFADWLNSPAAEDLNDDGQINEIDFDIFIYQTAGGGFMPDPNMPPGGWWWGGDPNMAPPPGGFWGGDPNMAPPPGGFWGGDPNMLPPGGGFIPDPNMPPGGGWGGGTFAPLSLNDWLASPMAQDLNNDGQINEEDYDIYLNSQPNWWGGMDPNMIPNGGGGMIMGGGNGALTWLGSDTPPYEQAYELKSAKTPDPWAILITACDVLNNTPSEQLADVVDDVLAVDRWLWFLAMENIFTDDDSYLTKGWDYQIYYDPLTGKIHPLQHDGNETFSTMRINRSPFEGENSPQRPIISRLLSIPQLRERYIAHIRTIIEESLDFSILAPQIEAYRALIHDEVMADTKKLYSNNEFEQGFIDLENFINGRRTYLLNNAQVNKPAPEVSSVVRKVSEAEDISSPMPGEPVWILAYVEEGVNIEQAVLYYTAGADSFEQVPMFFADVYGDNFSGDILVGGIPPFPAGSVVRYYVEVRTAGTGEGSSFAPYDAENYNYTYTVFVSASGPPPIVINELMATNQTTIQDPQGEYDDWIELLNIGDLEIDLSGMYLSDKADNPLKWEIPQGTTLAPGAYLIVWADENGGDIPGLHANFKLSAIGEMVLLSDRNERGNTLIDSIVFEAQETDVSYGRFPNGTGQFDILYEPTPLFENLAPRINFLDADGDGYTIGEGDCADANPAINPGAIEVNDAQDNNCNGFVDEEIAEIEDISPAYAAQGNMDILVTITLDEQTQMLPAGINLLRVKIGTLDGTSINRSGLVIKAVFDIPLNEPVGMKSVSVVFQPPVQYTDPNGYALPAGNIIVTESDAFEIRAASTGTSGGTGSSGTSTNYLLYMNQLLHMPFVPQTGFGYLPQNLYGFGLQIPLAPQSGLNFKTQGLLGFTPQDSLGYALRSLLVYVQQSWLTPQSWFSYTPLSMIGLAPQYGFGYIPQSLYGFGYQSWSLQQNRLGYTSR